MNLDLHHGYRLTPGTDPATFPERLRAVMDPIRDRLDASLFADLAVRRIDAADAQGMPRTAKPLQEAYEKWAHEQENMSRHSVWFDPNYLEMKLGHDPVTDTRVLILHASEKDYKDALLAMPEVESFSYRAIIEEIPDGVTEAEWEHRRDVWNRLLPRGRSDGFDHFKLRPEGSTGYGPIHAMLTASEEAAREHSPTVETRARRSAAEIYARWLHREQEMDLVRAVSKAMHTDLECVLDGVFPCIDPVTVALLEMGAGRPRFQSLTREQWDGQCELDFARNKELWN